MQDPQIRRGHGWTQKQRKTNPWGWRSPKISSIQQFQVTLHDCPVSGREAGCGGYRWRRGKGSERLKPWRIGSGESKVTGHVTAVTTDGQWGGSQGWGVYHLYWAQTYPKQMGRSGTHSTHKRCILLLHLARNQTWAYCCEAWYPTRKSGKEDISVLPPPFSLVPCRPQSSK